MCTVLIADDELATVKQLFNSIIERNKEVKLIGITNNGEEVLNIMEKDPPDILLLDLMMPKMNGFQVMEKLIAEKKKYLIKTKIIVISSYIDKLYRHREYLDYIYAMLAKPYSVDQLMKFIDRIDEEIKEDKIERYVKEELNTFSFNKDTDAYKYLKETICVAIRNNNMKVGLETDIYKKIAIIHKKSPIQIKWAIEKLMNSMYMNTRCEIIKSYFEFVEDKKPTTKVFIQHIVDNYKK